MWDGFSTRQPPEGRPLLAAADGLKTRPTFTPLRSDRPSPPRSAPSDAAAYSGSSLVETARTSATMSFVPKTASFSIRNSNFVLERRG